MDRLPFDYTDLPPEYKERILALEDVIRALGDRHGPNAIIAFLWSALLMSIAYVTEDQWEILIYTGKRVVNAVKGEEGPIQ